MSTPLVPVSERDYLTEDPQLRGQNYVCLSFLSPEDILTKKDVFFFHKYLSQFSNDVKTLFEGLLSRYPNDADLIRSVQDNYKYLGDVSDLQTHYDVFLALHANGLEEEFAKANDFQTSVRGIKVRGVFESLQEAQNRCQVLKRQGDKFDIYVAQVGVWCPWAPRADQVENQEFAETHLNTMMKKFQENMQLRDQMFQERKDQMVARAKPAEDAAAGPAPGPSGEPAGTPAPEGLMDGEDPWLAQKQENTSGA